MTFTKADLIDQLHASNPKMTKAQARQAGETFLRIIKSSLESSEDVLLSGFGKFSVKEKAARKGRNPKTGDAVIIEARRVVTFKPAGKLRSHVNTK